MGLFDLPAPLLVWLDQAALGALPSALRVAVWGVIGGALSMGLYRLISPQARIAGLKQAALAARRKMATYDGEFSGLGPLAFESLGLSFRHVGSVLLPAVIASLPVLCLLAWLSNSYGYAMPSAGETVAVVVEPEATVAWQSETGAANQDTGAVPWPADDQTAEMLDEGARALVALPLAAPVPVIHKQQWWNYLLGNPIGYLPDDSPVEKVTIALPPRPLIAVEPAWLGGWEMIFLSVLLLTSIAIKVAFRIH